MSTPWDQTHMTSDLSTSLQPKEWPATSPSPQEETKVPADEKGISSDALPPTSTMYRTLQFLLATKLGNVISIAAMDAITMAAVFTFSSLTMKQFMEQLTRPPEIFDSPKRLAGLVITTGVLLLFAFIDQMTVRRMTVLSLAWQAFHCWLPRNETWGMVADLLIGGWCLLAVAQLTFELNFERIDRTSVSV